MIFAIKKYFFWVVYPINRLKQKHWRWIVNNFPLNDTFGTIELGAFQVS